jgi:hypothetical protein
MTTLRSQVNAAIADIENREFAEWDMHRPELRSDTMKRSRNAWQETNGYAWMLNRISRIKAAAQSCDDLITMWTPHTIPSWMDNHELRHIQGLVDPVTCGIGCDLHRLHRDDAHRLVRLTAPWCRV